MGKKMAAACVGYTTCGCFTSGECVKFHCPALEIMKPKRCYCFNMVWSYINIKCVIDKSGSYQSPYIWLGINNYLQRLNAEQLLKLSGQNLKWILILNLMQRRITVKEDIRFLWMLLLTERNKIKYLQHKQWSVKSNGIDRVGSCTHKQ